LFSAFVTLGNFSELSVPQLPHLQIQGNNVLCAYNAYQLPRMVLGHPKHALKKAYF
jgi:hypothetical protein